MDKSAIRDVLEGQRAATLMQIRTMRAELDAVMDASTDANGDDEHDPEGPTIAYERAQLVGLLSRAQLTLEDLDRAVVRLSAGTYSVCEGCQVQIPSERLAALPAVRTCRSCAGGTAQ